MTTLQDHSPTLTPEPTLGAVPFATPSDLPPASAGSPEIGKPKASGGSAAVNVGESERSVSLAAGGILIGLGLSRRSAPGLLVAAVGAGLVHRGLTGHCAGYAAMGIDTSDA